MRIAFVAEECELDAVRVARGCLTCCPGWERHAANLKTLNGRFGNLDSKGPHWVQKLLSEDLPHRVAVGRAHQHACVESDEGDVRELVGSMKWDTEILDALSDPDGFRHWLSERPLGMTHNSPRAGLRAGGT